MTRPPELTMARIMRQTTEARLPGMMRNVALNMHLILDGKDVVELTKHKNVPIIVVGAGPSLWREGHLDLLKSSGWQFPIVACDRVLVEMLEKGIIPDYVGSVDGHPIIADFFKNPIVDEYADRVKAVMPVTIHPETASSFKGEINWFVPRMDNFTQEGWISLTKSLQYMCAKSVLVTGANCGTSCWNLGFYLHFNPIILIGMDLSYDTLDYTKTTYYDILKNYYQDEEVVKKVIKKGFNPVFKRSYLIDPIFDTYRVFTMSYINRVGVTTFNCTGAGSLFGGRVQSVPLKNILKHYTGVSR